MNAFSYVLPTITLNLKYFNFLLFMSNVNYHSSLHDFTFKLLFIVFIVKVCTKRFWNF